MPESLVKATKPGACLMSFVGLYVGSLAKKSRNSERAL